MKPDPIVVVSAARTPMGAFQGELKGFAAPQLGAAAIRAAVERAKLKPEEVQEVLMGCVLPAGQGQAPARQAAAKAGKSDLLALWAGQAAPLSRALPAAELVAKLEAEAIEAIRKLKGMIHET